MSANIDAAFFERISILDPNAFLTGKEAGWQAPIAVFMSRDGFGDNAWIEALPITCLAYRLSGAVITSYTKRCANRTSGLHRDIGFQPSGTSNFSVCKGPIRFAHIYIPDEMFDRAGAELMRPGISQHLRDDLWFVADETFDRLVSDYVLRGVYQKLRPTRLEMEARFTLILEHLITQYHSSNQTPKKVGGLAPYQLRLVQNFLEERIDRDVSLAQLAQIADLSTFHLCRAFKQSTGLPPHRWRMARRIERARDMLETTDLTVMEVAAAVGFDNPSGFASAFRKALGVTPSDYRRQRRF